MKIALGSDHAGFNVKEYLCNVLKARGVDVVDLGTHYPTPSDYPDYARYVGNTVANGDADFGVLICSTGIGMSVAANKVNGVRAALCANTHSAELARKHNNANILCIGAKFCTKEQAIAMLEKFITTPFDGDTKKGERHRRRVQKIAEIERQSERT